MKRVYILCRGRIQGVGFRSFVAIQAAKQDCTGWARNLENGDVEIELQGEDSKIMNVINNLRKGNMFIRLDEYILKDIPVIEEKSFRIKY